MKKQGIKLRDKEAVKAYLDKKAEAELVKSANFEKLKADYRATMAAYAAKQYLGSESLQDAMEDLEEEIEDME